MRGGGTARRASGRREPRRRGCAATIPAARGRSGRDGSSLRRPSVVWRVYQPPPRHYATAPAVSARSAASLWNSLYPFTLLKILFGRSEKPIGGIIPQGL